ncbi:short-chain dehydrogenase [Ruegeria profundi]|uniref:Short-chain dehydrogenase n=1 Tax=Ruegeria profundi TaxID=1685378 RepID=A0A0X3TR54_9RHOB|nr:short-chain dehydrogenase [Ruegeria profundi]
MPSPGWKSVPPTRGLVCNVIVKIVTLFLIAMGVLAMFGKLRFPGQKRLQSARCPRCGRFRIGKGPCACEKGGRT